MKLKEVCQNPQAVFVIDNFNFQDTVRDESIGNKPEQINLTTGAVVICPELPVTGLTQDMHNPSIPLEFMDIINSPAISGVASDGTDDKISSQISTALIIDAIK